MITSAYRPQMTTPQLNMPSLRASVAAPALRMGNTAVAPPPVTIDLAQLATEFVTAKTGKQGAIAAEVFETILALPETQNNASFLAWSRELLEAERAQAGKRQHFDCGR